MFVEILKHILIIQNGLFQVNKKIENTITNSVIIQKLYIVFQKIQPL